MSLFLLICVFVVLVTVFGPETFGLRPKPGLEWIRWPAGLLFGAAGVLFARHVFERAPQVVISPRGIFMRQWSDETIAWTAIRKCRVDRVTVRWPLYQRIICLELHDPASHPPTATRARFFGRGLNRGHGDITMRSSGLDYEVEDVWAAIKRFAPAEVELDGSLV